MHLVMSSAPLEAARTLAFKLIEERAAACVSVVPGMRSVYRWEGAVEESQEALLLMKTSSENVPHLVARVAALHPYDVPEILAFDVASAHGPYAQWVDDETADAKKP